MRAVGFAGCISASGRLVRPFFDRETGQYCVQVVQLDPCEETEALEPRLRAHLRHSEGAGREPAPALPQTTRAWVELVQQYCEIGSEYERDVFRLLDALLGDADGLHERGWGPDNPKAERRAQHAVSAWLRSVNRKIVEEQLRLDPPADVAAAALRLLCANGVREACLRLQPQFPRLAIICAALGGHPGGSLRRCMLQKQLDLWPSEPFMPRSVFRLYKLLAGEVSAAASGQPDWRLAFGLFVWYAATEGTLQDALEEFEDFRLSQAGPAQPDLQLNLLKLGRTIPWEDFAAHIDWKTYSSAPMDVALSWHVADLLGGSTLLTLQYAEQLEMVGLWHWAAYVLGLGGHEALQEEIVQRHAAATPQLEQREVFVAHLVTAPVVWSCKALRAEAEHSYLIAAQCYREVPAAAHVAQLLLDKVLAPVLSAVNGSQAEDLAVVQTLLAWLTEQRGLRHDWAGEVALFREYLAGESDFPAMVEPLTALLEQPAHPLRACAREVQRVVWRDQWEGSSYEEALDELIASV